MVQRATLADCALIYSIRHVAAYYAKFKTLPVLGTYLRLTVSGYKKPVCAEQLILRKFSLPFHCKPVEYSCFGAQPKNLAAISRIIRLFAIPKRIHPKLNKSQASKTRLTLNVTAS